MTRPRKKIRLGVGAVVPYGPNAVVRDYLLAAITKWCPDMVDALAAIAEGALDGPDGVEARVPVGVHLMQLQVVRWRTVARTLHGDRVQFGVGVGDGVVDARHAGLLGSGRGPTLDEIVVRCLIIRPSSATRSQARSLCPAGGVGKVLSHPTFLRDQGPGLHRGRSMTTRNTGLRTACGEG